MQISKLPKFLREMTPKIKIDKDFRLYRWKETSYLHFVSEENWVQKLLKLTWIKVDWRKIKSDLSSAILRCYDSLTKHLEWEQKI